MSGVQAAIEALEVTASNIRSLGPAGAFSAAPFAPYRIWLNVVETALATIKSQSNNIPVSEQGYSTNLVLHCTFQSNDPSKETQTEIPFLRAEVSK